MPPRPSPASLRATMSTLAPSAFSPSTTKPSGYFHFPGLSSESTKVAREVLEENNRGYDIYESRRFAHNHFPHSLLTRYALGAPPHLLRKTWEHDKSHLVSLDPRAPDRKDVNADKLPDKIDRGNWGTFLGNKEYYSLYLPFFHSEIARLGSQGALIEYVFSPQANWEPFTPSAYSSTGKQSKPKTPNMLNRLMAGALHPMIHVGFGLEFVDPIVLAEGLAEAAIHPDSLITPFISPSLTQSWLTSPVPSPSPSSPAPSLAELYTALVNNPTLKPVPYNPDSMINDQLLSAVSDGRGEALVGLVEGWEVPLKEDYEGEGGKFRWEGLMRDVGVFTTLLACGTGRKGYEPRVDFFLMHALTSSIFIPAYLPLLTPPQIRAFLKTYLLVLFQIAISRGRPALNPDLIMSYDLYTSSDSDVGSKQDEGKEGKKIKSLLDPSPAGEGKGKNVWLDIIDRSLSYPDSHIVKSIRSLVFYSQLFGSLPAGSFAPPSSSKNRTELQGLEKVDGTLFQRAAGVIMRTIPEGEEEARWDRSQLGYDGAWTKGPGQGKL
ncbi:hypothetical protein L202_03881 [Cryptococcus amylolentus CBS 6039]|uniref:Uncharacterized protein n=1 Tax=Cryptococcus amylolentus CBS 6039 TaxID=1295533 RepID=A0A1E3HUM5_9TREE|nr:hypothetical protein L202_03881 [Cryptococcus amylolentus CBS 6039]ODN80020.1 hypothetical protein L202_03881 [Cryptococcus amylolentus CBS 6039]